jgi:hypothetical protein
MSFSVIAIKQTAEAGERTVRNGGRPRRPARAQRVLLRREQLLTTLREQLLTTLRVDVEGVDHRAAVITVSPFTGPTSATSSRRRRQARQLRGRLPSDDIQ